MKKLLLIDTSALFFRSRSALTRACGELTTSTGIPVTGTMAFLNAMFKVMDDYEYDCVIPCAEGGNNWRKKESEGEYKGTRKSQDVAFYADQSLLLEEVLPTLGMSVVKMPGFEADDVIAHISRHSPAYDEIHILSCDKDLLQLVTNKVKVLLFSSSKKMELVDIDGVIRHFQCFPAEVKYFKALAGDKSDNVAGIAGIGPKTAVKIINECKPEPDDEVGDFTGADRICMHQKVRDQAGTFLANLRLVTLEGDIPALRWFASSAPDSASVVRMLEELEFRTMLKRKKKILATLGCVK